MRGELDWIVMKTLEKDRHRRYETANGFAADVQRYLNDEPVQACPPSRWYRLRKFARRNKGPVLAATLVLLALVGGVIGTTIGLFQADEAHRAAVKQRQLAEANEQKALDAAEAEKKSKETALAREAETRAVLEFVENKVFAAARPEGQDGGLGAEVTLRQALEAALPFVAASFRDQPLIEARLRMTLGASFLYLGDAKIAAEQTEAARALYSQHLGGDHPDMLKCMTNLAGTYFDLGRHAEALQLREETLALQKAKLGPDHIDTLRSMNNLATSYEKLSRHAEAHQLYEETLALRKAKLGPDHPDTHEAMWLVASGLVSLDRHAEALPIIDEFLRRAADTIVDRDLIQSMMNLRLRPFEKIGDAVGCLESADKWEGLKRSDAASLYDSACFRSICAAVIRDTDATPAGQVKAKDQADHAMAWLKQAVAAGFNDAAHIEKDKDLDALRDREDFRKLLTELVGGSP